MIQSIISKRFFKRGYEFACRHIFFRSLPHGMVCPFYFLPFQSQNTKIHRTLWLRGFPQIPLPVFVVIDLLLWLRWVLFSGWRHTIDCVLRLGPSVRAKENLGLVSQFSRVLFFSLFYCIPPGEIYAFQLFRKNQKACVSDYIFTHELPAFHRWRSAALDENSESWRLLQDKHCQSELLTKDSVPMVSTLQLVPRGNLFDADRHLEKFPEIVCKPRHGSGAGGIFVVSKKNPDDALLVYGTRAGALTAETSWAALKKAFALDDYLIQPFMKNHPELARLCPTDDVVTVRIITESRADSRIEIYCALLEIPAFKKNNDSLAPQGHVILPVDLATGGIKRFSGILLHSHSRENYERVYSSMDQHIIPFWEGLCKNSIIAHKRFYDVYAIAWDYVVTPDGPLLLEGNTGWDTRMPQIINGGLLSLAK